MTTQARLFGKANAVRNDSATARTSQIDKQLINAFPSILYVVWRSKTLNSITCEESLSFEALNQDWQEHETVTRCNSGFPLDLENLEKIEYTWKTWKYGILKNLITIMEKWH